MCKVDIQLVQHVVSLHGQPSIEVHEQLMCIVHACWLAFVA